jgi:hypothetical protein
VPSGAIIWESVGQGLRRYDAATGSDLGATAISAPELVPDGEGGVWTFQPDGDEADRMFQHVDADGTVTATGAIGRQEGAMWGGVATAFDPVTNSLWVIHYEDSASVIRIR